MRYPKSFFALFILAALFISKPLFSQSYDKNIDSTTFSSLLFTHQFKTDTVSLENMAALKEKLIQLDFISGTVRFSGAGFPSVASIELKNNSMKATSVFLNRCQSGSKITFEKSIIKNRDGTSSKPVNKSIIIH